MWKIEKLYSLYKCLEVLNASATAASLVSKFIKALYNLKLSQKMVALSPLPNTLIAALVCSVF